MKLLAIALVVSAALCDELKLQLRNVETGATIPWGIYDYNIDTLNANTLESVSERESNRGAYCVDAIHDGRDLPCFSFLDIEDPLHYNLVIDVHEQELKKLSLVHNPQATGIEPYVRVPRRGPDPPAVKLKKTTKTYQDKKANKEATTAQFSSEDNGGEEKSWFQKNWKVIVIGLIIYNVIAVMNKQDEIKEEVDQDKKPLID